MKKILNIVRLYFSSMISLQIITCAGNLLLQLLISVAVINLVDKATTAGSLDFVVIVTVFVLGIIFFSPGFEYALSMGISRKTYFWAGCAVITAMSAVFTVLLTIFYAVSLKVADVWMLYEMVYNDQSILGMMVWEFAALLFIGILGWLIRLAYYVSGRTTRYVISFAPFVLASLLVFFNILADGVIGRALLSFIKAVAGFSASGANPYIGMASMLAAAVILGVPVYLMLRRAQRIV
jgi:hypothetical protein